MNKKNKDTNWVTRWGTEVRPTKLPGVFLRRDGGHYVRARVLDPNTGKLKEVKKSMPHADEATAYQWLHQQRQRVANGVATALPAKTRFADYAVSLLERKIAKRVVKSARGRERWRYTLQHLIEGTKGVPGFGEYYIDRIAPHHVEAWQVGIAKLIAAGTYAPTTANGWLHILKNVLVNAKRELGLPSNVAEAAQAFDTSEHHTYTEEEPNALDAAEAQAFLAAMLSDFPQHYAMTCLGFATGLRPSSLRPLRRQGPTPDVLWGEGVILVRRSHTLGEQVMETTKTGLRQRICIPPELVAVLTWHADTQLPTPEQQASDLLFPRADGGLRSESSLKKAFTEASRLAKLDKKFTPRGMRRTFNDMARQAGVESLVTKSISGHLTDRMKDHYSTVRAPEQRDSIGRVLRLVHAASSTEPDVGGANGGASGEQGGAESKTG